MLDDPSAAQKKGITFQSELTAFRVELEKSVLSLENKYDLQPSRKILEEIAEKTRTQNYLKSLQGDVERMSKNAYSN